MILEKVFDTMQKQYTRMFVWMDNISVYVGVLRENNTIQTIKIEKTLKRIARIEEKLKIVNIEEGD